MSTPIACNNFAEFEQKVGSQIAADVLQRICEELYNRDSQFGVMVDSQTRYDRLKPSDGARL